MSPFSRGNRQMEKRKSRGTDRCPPHTSETGKMHVYNPADRGRGTSRCPPSAEEIGKCRKERAGGTIGVPPKPQKQVKCMFIALQTEEGGQVGVPLQQRK